jgi:hypothetical protein
MKRAPKSQNRSVKKLSPKPSSKSTPPRKMSASSAHNALEGTSLGNLLTSSEKMTACVSSKCKTEADAVKAFTQDYFKRRLIEIIKADPSLTQDKPRMLKSLETAYQDLMHTDIVKAYGVCLSSGCLPEMVAMFKGILDHTERKLQTIKEQHLKVSVEDVTEMEAFIAQGRNLLNKHDISTDDIREFIMKTLFDGLLTRIISGNEDTKPAQAARVKSGPGERSSPLAEVKGRKERVSGSKPNPKRKVRMSQS